MTKRKTIAVFTPYLSGFYLGEVAAHIRREAADRDFNLLVVMTTSFGSYELSLAFDHIDGAFVVLNSVSSVNMKKMLERGIPVVSTVEDYFPLQVEAVVSDQRSGIQHAFEHLYRLGHRRIGYAGDISIVDMRIRYEAILDCYQEKGLEFNERDFFSVDEPTLPGGRVAGRMYLDRGCEPKAIICACDLTAIGMKEYIAKAGIEIPRDLVLIGVDNTSLGQTRRPSLTSIDQNISQMVSLAFDRLEARFSGKPYLDEVQRVPQTLRIRESCGAEPSIRTSDAKSADAESDDLQNQNESALALAKSGYDSILNLSSLWGPFLDWGCLAHWSADASLNTTHIFSEEYTESELSEMEGLTCTPENFPPNNLSKLPFPDKFLITVIPITAESNEWAVLSIVDELRADMQKGRYSMFNNYLDLISFFMQRDALVVSVREREKNAQELAERLEVVANTSNDGIWTWDLQNNTVEWNNRILEMLGFTDEHDIHIYRNMSFLERIHPQDKGYISKLLKDHLEGYKAFKAKFRIQANNGRYIWVDASGEALREPDGHVGRFVGSMTDITEQRLSEQKIKHMAYHDSLTGLPNRAMVTETLVKHIVENPNESLAIMLMDLNRFKMVNDSYGHEMGDALLVHVANKIRAAMRRTDMLARFGGDEFVMLCHVRDEQEAIVSSQRILKTLNGVFKHNQIEIAVKGSLGVALYPKDSTTGDELIKKADIAMYHAKRLQLDCGLLYTEGLDVNLKDVMAMENHLLRSIENNELFLLLQPQVDTVSEEVVGAEVLVRWNSAEFGLVSPAKFIPLAEEVGFISSLGDWVTDEALRFLVRWKKNNVQPMKLSINVSAGQLYKPDFADVMTQKVSEAGVDPTLVNLEITESTAINDIEQSAAALSQLSRLGMSVSLDDFGTGYSSLSLLNELPLEWVKIDRSFVQLLKPQDALKGMVKSLTEMCHSLGYRVVAEGVETQGQLKTIQGIGCDQIQGFFYSKPIPLEEFEARFIHGENKICRPAQS